ncbi:MAG: tyrosine-protein phosphatase [Clostridium sp.]|nr:tyrosine-protein phosphatase [Clostridium sp.]
MHYVQQRSINHVGVSRIDCWLNIAIDNPGKNPIRLYMGKKPDYRQINQMVAEGDENLFVLFLPVEKGPYYFYYRLGGEISYIFSERVIPLQGAINVRDMGGYRTTDGRFVKWGKLFRGDQLSKLTDQDINQLETLNIKTIIDYRSAHERSINPNRSIHTVKKVFQLNPQSDFSEATALAIDLEDENEKLVASLRDGTVPEHYINGKGRKVIESYRNFVFSPACREAYKTVIQIHADLDAAPILQHCRGGKDRTGFGAMLVLLLLKVKPEDVMFDYTLTGVLRQERNALKKKHYSQLTDNENHIAYLMSLIETRKEFIGESMRAINEECGGVEAYAREIYGITDDEIAAMRYSYLEEVQDG